MRPAGRHRFRPPGEPSNGAPGGTGNAMGSPHAAGTMKAWRLGAALTLAALAGAPLALPFAEALFRAIASDGVPSVVDFSELGSLAVNTLLLAAGTIAVAVPLGAL